MLTFCNSVTALTAKNKSPNTAFAKCTAASKSIDAACICIEAINATEVEEMQVNFVFVFVFVFSMCQIHTILSHICWLWVTSDNDDILTEKS